MAHAKIDNLYDDKRKIKRAWKAHPANPIGVHVMAITYCQRHNLDGRVPNDWFEEIMPKPREREQIIKTMLREGLLDAEEHTEGEYCVHDFLDWNESAAERTARGNASRKAAASRWANANGNA